MTDDWLRALNDCRRADAPCVLVTVLALRGSLPRGPGSKMLVAADYAAGSVGGSALEHRAQRFARELLAGGVAEPVRRDFDVASGAGLTLLFEPFLAADFNVLVFGAGHVGSALVGVLATLPCRVRWLDRRAALLPTTTPANVTVHSPAAPEREVAGAPPGSFVVLCSHSHEEDFAVAAAALARDDLRYVGMIGSRRKRAQLARYLLDHCPPLPPLDERLVCPIGVAGIAGRTPVEIAVAVAAQLLQVRDR